MKAPTPHLWCALLLPIVAFAALVVRAELWRASGPVFHVAIAGYDPRNLLQGHYLRYRLQWRRTVLTTAPHAACVCIDIRCAYQSRVRCRERGL